MKTMSSPKGGIVAKHTATQNVDDMLFFGLRLLLFVFRARYKVGLCP